VVLLAGFHEINFQSAVSQFIEACRTTPSPFQLVHLGHTGSTKQRYNVSAQQMLGMVWSHRPNYYLNLSDKLARYRSRACLSLVEARTREVGRVQFMPIEIIRIWIISWIIAQCVHCFVEYHNAVGLTKRTVKISLSHFRRRLTQVLSAIIKGIRTKWRLG
jgi:hypothetical protein